MSDGAWITDPNDDKFKAEPRGNPGDCFYENGGWRCAGVMWPRGPEWPKVADHLIGSPYFNASPSGDGRHSCYCVKCAKESFGIEPPADV